MSWLNSDLPPASVRAGSGLAASLGGAIHNGAGKLQHAFLDLAQRKLSGH